MIAKSSATFTTIPNCWKEVSKMGRIIFVNDHKFYYELDGIRLIYEDNQLTGWYDPELSEVI